MVRSFHVDNANKEAVTKIVRDNVDRESAFYTDESRLYADVQSAFKTNGTVRHSAYEYVRGDVHTNTVEGFYPIFKRGMKGVYQHCAEHHLHRYLAKFDFRYSYRVARGVDGSVRALLTLQNVKGRRLTYRRPVAV